MACARKSTCSMLVATYPYQLPLILSLVTLRMEAVQGLPANWGAVPDVTNGIVTNGIVTNGIVTTGIVTTGIVTLQDGGLQRFGEKCDERTPEQQGVVGEARGAKPTGGGITFLQVSSEDLAPTDERNTTQQPNDSGNASGNRTMLTTAKLDTGEASIGVRVPTPAPIPPSLPSDPAQPSTQSLVATPEHTSANNSSVVVWDSGGIVHSDAPLDPAADLTAPLLVRDGAELQGTSEASIINTRQQVVFGNDYESKQGGLFLGQHGNGALAVLIIGVAIMSSAASVCIVLFVGSFYGSKVEVAFKRLWRFPFVSAHSTTASKNTDASWAVRQEHEVVEASGCSALGGESCNKLGIRTVVESMTVSSHFDIERLLPTGGSYDCAISRPLISRGVVRLEGRIEAFTSGNMLTAPLTLKKCVMYSVAVTRQVHDGILSVPIAYATANVSFTVVLKAQNCNVDSKFQDGSSGPEPLDEPPPLRVHIEGGDVSLFDMRDGCFVARRQFMRAPDHWQDFVLTHRASPQGAEFQSIAALQGDSSLLDFQECSLCVGSIVTLVGELHRGTDGTLSLNACHDPWPSDFGGPETIDRVSPSLSPGATSPQSGIRGHESWRTSWEQDTDVGSPASHIGSVAFAETSQITNILASDDPLLLAREAPSSSEADVSIVTQTLAELQHTWT